MFNPNTIYIPKKFHKPSIYLGSVDKGIIEVTNCFCVPHKEHADQVEAELSYALDVYELNRRVNSSESIVGTYKIKTEHIYSSLMLLT